MYHHLRSNFKVINTKLLIVVAITLNEVMQGCKSLRILDVDITAGLTQVHAQFGYESAFVSSRQV